jgi:secondary thiamine-phosphate synthase enzyme
MEEIRLQTDRKTQLVDITDKVRSALSGGAEGSALLVYVPHTTAAVTINEKIDPALVRDLEGAFQKVVGNEWGWTHDDKDGPNGPSHGRASVVGPQVLVPLRGGKLALGTYQGIFFCEFDGPRSRSIYVSVLQ